MTDDADRHRLERDLAPLDVPWELFACDPALADTAAFCAAYGFDPADSANTIVVVGKSEPRQYAACVVLATHRLDVNKVVRAKFGRGKASFADPDETRAMTGMEIGGVTPFGLPPTLPVWVDAEVMRRRRIVLGGGSRSWKVLASPEILLRLPAVEVVDGLASPAPAPASAPAPAVASPEVEAMDRAAWLRDVRQTAERRYDELFAATYDAQDIPMTGTHRRLVERVVAVATPGGVILDVPCGTGKYMGLILDAGRHVVGIDQSAGMLAQARLKHPDAELRHGGLQELASDGEFDGVICVDSMENVSPEDWPLVLRNLRRAVRPTGLVYLTVEEIDGAERDRAFAAARADGLPVVPGEHTSRGGGYHHYPERTQVLAWLRSASLDVVEEAETPGDGYGYWHLLLRPRSS